MGVPGTRGAPPPEIEKSELFAVDAYRRSFDSTVLAVDREQNRVALARTAFYPGGGGQPHDVGTLRWDGGSARVTRVKRDAGRIWHWLDAEDPSSAEASRAPLPSASTEVLGELDWERRHTLMRTHTALHILCGVIWSEYRIAVTGGNMEPGRGRLDFPLDHIDTGLGRRVERRINEEVDRAREVLVDFLDRSEADLDPALIRTAVGLIPREIDPLRVIDIVGLDKQADGGTHVADTAEVGRVAVTGTSSKGRSNKRIRIELRDPPAPG
ncbi:alanyl-tRNA editing protein [Nocardiopsis composta]|uniref:Misacylated tRNA(Ala) deacylase n=1 Tax=Nocardiopsis composta TaxID=157465 RepID=A0A7W8VFQ6_9ACTN|nr:alanyl-tRNA editing protein [Nocardiopsis composta]MBB5434378.1 misacylated tRNA(Ala) deacylase [Nocardiopsis composta]